MLRACQQRMARTHRAENTTPDPPPCRRVGRPSPSPVSVAQGQNPRRAFLVRSSFVVRLPMSVPARKQQQQRRIFGSARVLPQVLYMLTKPGAAPPTRVALRLGPRPFRRNVDTSNSHLKAASFKDLDRGGELPTQARSSKLKTLRLLSEDASLGFRPQYSVPFSILASRMKSRFSCASRRYVTHVLNFRSFIHSFIHGVYG